MKQLCDGEARTQRKKPQTHTSRFRFAPGGVSRQSTLLLLGLIKNMFIHAHTHTHIHKEKIKSDTLYGKIIKPSSCVTVIVRYPPGSMFSNPKILHHGPHCAGLSCPPLISIASTSLEQLYDDEKIADLHIIQQCFFFWISSTRNTQMNSKTSWQTHRQPRPYTVVMANVFVPHDKCWVYHSLLALAGLQQLLKVYFNCLLQVFQSSVWVYFVLCAEYSCLQPLDKSVRAVRPNQAGHFIS